MITELALDRRIYTPVATTGEITLGGVRWCYAVEDHYPTPYVKTPGKTAIPEGRYKVTIERSPRFSKLAGYDVLLPRLHDVPQFTGVLIHSGNDADDSLGCVIVGKRLGVNRVDESRAAMKEIIMPRLTDLCIRGDVFLNVRRAS